LLSSSYFDYLPITTKTALQLLAKSKIISGIQCHKKLWLETHGKQDIVESHLFALGSRFGEFARTHYGEGVNLDGKKLSENVVELTNAAISNPDTKAIYEAAFVQENVLVRVDVLKRDKDGWAMIEVKSSKEAKPHHLNDIADTTGIDDGEAFLDFLSPTLSRDFLSSLISALGDSGTIFVHHKSTEIKALRYLAAQKQCEDLNGSVEKIIFRIEDTLDLVRDGMYFPEMGLPGGSTYSIKTITKVIPKTVDYQ
jgi:hypothetical protein